MTSVSVVFNARQVLVRSCAIFDRQLRELRYPALTILDRDEHQELGRTGAWHDGLRLKRFEFPSFDRTDCYDPHIFRNAADTLSARLLPEIDTAKKSVAQLWQAAGPKILLIDRGPSDDYYLREGRESGRQRRSIANFEDLRAALTVTHSNICVALLEGTTLSYQIALFQTADIVIAQHGAALANLVWAKPTTGSIEIAPADLTANNAPIFGSLADSLGQRSERVMQSHRHGEVSADDVLRAIDRLLS
jgi:hypothetical protein